MILFLVCVDCFNAIFLKIVIQSEIYVVESVVKILRF